MESLSPQRKRREKRDRAVTFILALAGIGLGFVGIVWAAISWFICFLFLADWIGSTECAADWSTKRIRRVQITTVVSLTMCGGVPVYHQYKKEKAAALEGEIHARNPQMLEHPLVQWGDSGPLLPWKSPTLNLLRDAGVSFEMGADGIEISTTVRDRYGHLVAQITKNHWTVEPSPASVDKNYTDDTLEVEDGGGHVVLQVRLLSDRVQLRGEWHNEFGGGAQITDCLDPDNKKEKVACIELFGPSLPEQTNKVPIEPLFEYPSKDHWGEFRNKH